MIWHGQSTTRAGGTKIKTTMSNTKRNNKRGLHELQEKISLRGVSWNNEKLLIDSARKIIHDKFTFARSVLTRLCAQGCRDNPYKSARTRESYFSAFACSRLDRLHNRWLQILFSFAMHHPICIPSIQHRTQVFGVRVAINKLGIAEFEDFTHKQYMVVRMHWNWSASLSPISTLIQ